MSFIPLQRCEAAYEHITSAQKYCNQVYFFVTCIAGEHPAAMQHGEHGSSSCIGCGPWWLILLVATAAAAFSSTYCTIRQNGLLQAVSRWWVHGQLWINKGSNVKHIELKCLLQQDHEYNKYGHNCKGWSRPIMFMLKYIYSVNSGHCFVWITKIEVKFCGGMW